MPSLKLIASDLDAETEGRWFSDPWGSGLRFKLIRARGAKFGDRLSVLREEFLKDMREGKDIPDGEAERIIRDAFTFAVLLDWNVTDDDDKPIPYTPERGLEVMEDPAYSDLWDWLWTTSNEKSNYIKELQEAALKNSPAA